MEERERGDNNRMGPIAKICQTVPKYFNMEKYDIFTI